MLISLLNKERLLKFKIRRNYVPVGGMGIDAEQLLSDLLTEENMNRARIRIWWGKMLSGSNDQNINNIKRSLGQNNDHSTC